MPLSLPKGTQTSLSEKPFCYFQPLPVWWLLTPFLIPWNPAVRSLGQSNCFRKGHLTQSELMSRNQISTGNIRLEFREYKVETVASLLALWRDSYKNEANTKNSDLSIWERLGPGDIIWALGSSQAWNRAVKLLWVNFLPVVNKSPNWYGIT